MRISEVTEFDFEIPLLVEHGSPRRIIALLNSKGVVAPSHRSREAENHLGSRVKIVCLHQGNDHTPLYCMPNIAGSVSSYIGLAKMLGGYRPVYGIQIADQAQTGKLETFASLKEMAASMAAKLLMHHRDGPICLIGYSFGGYLAIEVARQLVGHGKLVPFVGIIDTIPGPACLARAYRIHHFARNVGPWALNFAPWALKVTTREITHARHWVNFRNIILRKLRRNTKCNPHDWYQKPARRSQEHRRSKSRPRAEISFRGHLPRHDFPVSTTPIGANVRSPIPATSARRLWLATRHTCKRSGRVHFWRS